jgi:ADP-ribose pyrophosphatase YjhB (NUDIX family)
VADPAQTILARGPWQPDAVRAVWREDAYQPDAPAAAEADRALERLRERGSPTHDGLAARLAGFELADGRLTLELQPIRWALRLSRTDAGDTISALCVVRDSDGRWLAGRRAGWVATWAGRWALGAGGAVEVGESPVATLTRELSEEWSVEPARLQIEALVRTPNRSVMLVAQAWLPPGAAVAPDHEHDQYSWWPDEVSRWPPEADPLLRDVGVMLEAA